MTTSDPNAIQSLILPITAEDYEKLAGSKFASPGLHLSEIIAPIAWKTKGKSVVFKFRIVEQGEDNGKENELTAGIEPGTADKPGSIWKFKECMKALGIAGEAVKTKDNAIRPKFNPVEPLGHQVYVEWVEEEGTNQNTGQPVKYVKPVKFWDLKTGAKMAGVALPADVPAAVEEEAPF